MRKLALLAVAILTISAPAYAVSDAPAMPDWLVGAWEHEDGEGWADEYWTPLRGDIMMGSARSGKDEKLTFWEQMRIQKEDDGAVVLWVVSADQKPVRFEATVSAENSIVFENPEHDYPQRIYYWREGKELKAETSLLDGSTVLRFSYGLTPARM
jgi:Domain of unknown function (DUF6265)